MKIKEDEPVLFQLQADPLAFVLQNAGGETITLTLPPRIAREIALQLLNIPEVANGFLTKRRRLKH